MSIPIQVAPPTNDLTLSKDQTFAEVVKINIPKSGVVPKVDVYFLADTTGSMNTAIAAVKSGIVDVMTRIQALDADVWFGVGDYKDYPAPVTGEHPYAFKHPSSLSGDIAQAKAAIDPWTTSPGKDTPEAQFYQNNTGGREPLPFKEGMKPESTGFNPVFLLPIARLIH